MATQWALQESLEEFDCRRPFLLTWARACFEQGSLSSMLHLGGSALLGVLPGDKMFQAQQLNLAGLLPEFCMSIESSLSESPSSLGKLLSAFLVVNGRGARNPTVCQHCRDNPKIQERCHTVDQG